MPLIMINRESATRAEVVSTHYQPETLPIEVQRRGIIVESVPTAVKQVGKDEKLYFNPITREFHFEYFDRGLTPEEKLDKLLTENATLRAKIDYQELQMNDTTFLLLELMESTIV